MQAFTKLTATAAPLLRANVDTDLIIPINRLIGAARGDLGRFCLEALRFDSAGSPDTSFVLNQTAYSQAKILVTGPNFGCGSSREHAVWALMELGFRVIIAESFGNIFYNNCFQNGVLPVVLPPDAVESIAREVGRDARGASVTVDLVEQVVMAPGGRRHPFSVDRMQRRGLLKGLDSVDLTLRDEEAITAFQTRDRRDRPWVYSNERIE